jgi:DNA-binding SARP family transcriptional activator/predicted ATPase
MAHLCITLLGNLQVTLDGQPVPSFKSNKDRALLAYLSVESTRAHRRESLAGLFWPEWPDRDALSNLRYTLSSLRRVIGDPQAQPPYLLITRDTLKFNPASDAWLDVAAFDTALEAGRTAVEKLEQAVPLYRGNFLEGFSLGDCPAFEEWALLTREKLRRQASSALHSLATACEKRGDNKAAQEYAWRLLEMEPWDETAHQQVMRLLALTGQRPAALAQYQACRRALAEGLQVEPGLETTHLYEQIRDGRLGGVSPPESSLPARTIRQPFFLQQETTPPELPVFVARQQELEQLEHFLDLALTGGGRVAFVTGESGSGKSLLLQEFTRRAETAHPTLVVAGGNCNAFTGIGDPYLPFREILGLLAGDVEARGMAGTITRETGLRLWTMLPGTVAALVDVGQDLIDTFLPRTALLERASAWSPDPSEWLSRLQTLLERKPHGGSVSISVLQADLFEQYTRLLQALAKANPLVLVLDDLQWADVGSISLLFHLGRRLAGCRILVLGAYRPEEISAGREGGRHALEPVINEFRRIFGDLLVDLDQSEGRLFINAFLDSEPNHLGNSFRAMLYRQTLGQPLFTIELLRGLQERGDLVKDAQGFWNEGPSLDWETLPARVEAAIQERVDRLPPELQRTLSLASVEGEIFTAEAMARVQGINEQVLLQHLSGELDRRHHLIHAESIQRLGGQSISRYRFRHMLFQRYLYGLLDEVERAHLHEQVGLALEGLYRVKEHLEANALHLARQFEQAGMLEKAIRYLLMAGERALELSAYPDGVAHITRALKLLESLPENLARDRIEVTLQLAMGKALRGDLTIPSWGKAINRARELCRQTGQVKELCRVLEELAVSYYVMADHRKAGELAEEALELAQKTSDVMLIILGHWINGFILFSRGEYLAARQHLGQVISVYDPRQHHLAFLHLHGSDPGTSAMTYDACCLWCLGYPDQAVQLAGEALSLARRLGHTFSLVDVLAFGGCLLSEMRRDAQALKSFGEEMMRLSKGMGFTSFGGIGTCYYGCALIWLGELDEGLHSFREGNRITVNASAWCHQSGLLGGLGEGLAAAGQLEEGLAMLNNALDLVEKSGEFHWAPDLLIQKSRLLLGQGDEAGAEDCLHKAVETARRQQAKSWELRATNGLCRLWQRQGKAQPAKKALAEVYNWFTEGFDTPDLQEARQLMQELA